MEVTVSWEGGILQRGGGLLIHSGTLSGGFHYSVVSQTFMSTSMERDGCEFRILCCRLTRRTNQNDLHLQ